MSRLEFVAKALYELRLGNYELSLPWEDLQKQKPDIRLIYMENASAALKAVDAYKS